MEANVYKGNANTFQNQPSFRVFNKSIEHSDDSLFTFLNDVDSELLKDEQVSQSQVFTSYISRFTAKDPRTQQLTSFAIYDHTTNRLPYEFPNPQERYSSLTAPQQAACVRLLLAWQQNSAESEDDFIVWRVTNGKRVSEQQLVQKHILDYVNAQKERIYAPMKPLVLLYGKWFVRRMQYVLRRLPNRSYSTHSGLPQLSQCKTLHAQVASMENIHLICHRGQVRLWPEVRMPEQELSNLRMRLERYAYAGSADEPASHMVAADLEQQLQEACNDVYVLPLESLLFLLIPGAYADLPTEVLVSIRELPDNGHKCIQFEEPMPARSCGWHTSSRLLTTAYAAYGAAQWLQLPDDVGQRRRHTVLQNSEPEHRRADKAIMEYKLLPIDEEAPMVTEVKANCALVSWKLRASESTDSLSIFSSLSVAAVRDAAAKEPLGCHLIKLESKPECGCEIMTKYEMVSIWLQLQLLQSNVGHCSRISLQDMQPLLEEKVRLSTLAQQLNEWYHISMPDLLSQLAEFLKLLSSISPGEYLLRYTSKYKDRFLLCQPTADNTSMSFKLHDLLMGASSPNNIDFLTQSSTYLPITPLLCSRLHEQLQLLPCAFPAKVNAKRGRPCKAPEVPTPLVQRVRMNAQKKKKTNSKNSRQRKKDDAKLQQTVDNELEKFMCL
ncbi:hypothetical protein AWZ03_013767 [Drosophila navojoa]|uniref:Little elongation complex subunit 2 C-terminal domain-containing protein n=1 Tax=Drosophila navojoa TaxID=7232 RepID=A0A484ATX7_DRONA|nr:little elongation complex subunit 2 [Drosophila navojoa]TDG39813.1 hypothetical protein AWZ03_013767 [Drosophila navojoa]